MPAFLTEAVGMKDATRVKLLVCEIPRSRQCTTLPRSAGVNVRPSSLRRALRSQIWP